MIKSDGMTKMQYALTAALLLSMFGMVGASTLTSASVVVGSLSGGMHVLNVTGITTSNGTSLPADSYAFRLTSSSVSITSLDSYFANKVGSSGNMYDQLSSEASGSLPFFYLVSDGIGGYGLEDGFLSSTAGGGTNSRLQINDDYPPGTYVYSGSIAGSSVSVTMSVSQPFAVSASVSTTSTTTTVTTTIPATGNGGGTVTSSSGGLPCASCSGTTTPYFDVYTNSVWIYYTNQTSVNTGIGIDNWAGMASWQEESPSSVLPAASNVTIANVTSAEPMIAVNVTANIV